MKNIFKSKMLLVSLLAILIIGIGGTYAYIRFFASGGDNVIVSGCLKLSFNEGQGLNLSDSQPVSDDIGLSSDPYNFTVTNSCSLDADYKVSINVLNSSSEGNDSKIKLSLDDGSSPIQNPTMVGSLTENVLAEPVDGVVKSYLLDSGVIGVGESKTYNLRMWIDNDVEDFSGKFDTKIITEATVLGDK